MVRLMRRLRLSWSVPLLLIVAATGLNAQVREQPVPFDTAGKLMTVTPALADSAMLSAPTWPVAGPYLEARLFKQSEGGYIIAVRRLDESVDRYAISLEQFAAIRSAVSGRGGSTAPPLREPVVEQTVPSTPAATPVRYGPEPGGRSFANGQALLAATVYGPALGHAVRSQIDDPLAYYAAWFGTVGLSLYIATRAANDPNISFAQSIEANHAGLHGAAIGAGLAYIAVGEVDEGDGDNDLAYGAGIFAGGVGGAVAGYYAAKRMTSAEAAASAFGADVGLLLGVASVVSRNRFDERFDRSAATTLIATTVGGYIAGPLYPKMSPDPVSVGDVLALSSTGLTGILAAGALVDILADSAERAANLLSTGLLVGIALGHPLLVRPIDHTVGEAGTLLAAAAGGAYGGAQLGSLGSEDPSAARVLALAAVGSAAAIWLMEKRFRIDRPTPGRRLGVTPGRSLPRVKFEPMSGALAALRAPGRHSLLKVTF